MPRTDPSKPYVDGLPVPKRTLLWTNPSPTSSFSKQSVSIPTIGNYDYALIEFKYYATYSNSDTQLKMFGTGAGSAQAVEWLWSDANESDYWTRSLVVKSDEVLFGDAREVMFKNNTVTRGVANMRLVPYRIYGVNW